MPVDTASLAAVLQVVAVLVLVWRLAAFTTRFEASIKAVQFQIDSWTTKAAAIESIAMHEYRIGQAEVRLNNIEVRIKEVEDR